MFSLKNVMGAARRLSMGRRSSDWDESSSAVPDEEVEIPRRATKEIMDEMADKYYKELDVTRFVLEGLPEGVDFGWLENAVWEHEHALENVNTDISTRVLNSYNEFVEGMGRIHEVGVNLQLSAVVCKNGRLSLKQAKQELAQSSLVIASKYRRQQIYKALISTLEDIKRVSNCTRDLDTQLTDGDYLEAIVKLRETEKMAADLARLMVPKASAGGVTYVRLRCVESLLRSIEGAGELLRRRLDDGLRQVMLSFDNVMYTNLIRAFQLLGRTYEILGRIQDNFNADLEQRSRKTIRAFLDQAVLQRELDDTASKQKLPDLCKGVPSYKFVPCILTLLGVCTDIMWNFHLLKKWHDEAVAHGSKELSQDQTLVDLKQGLDSMKRRLWESIQRNVGELLKNISFSQLPVEDAMKVVEAIQVFSHIGTEFGSASRTALLDVLKRQSVAYFNEIKLSMTEDLQSFLEREQWTPVPTQIKVSEVKELRAASMSGVRAATRLSRSFFGNYPVGANPFHDAASQYTDDSEKMTFAQIVERTGKRKLGVSVKAEDDDEEEDEEQLRLLQQEGMDDEAPSLTGKEEEQTIVTSSAISIVKKIGRYIQMMRVLETVSSDIFNGIVDLHNCYLWTVWNFFVAPPQVDILAKAKGVFGNLLVSSGQQASSAMVQQQASSGSTLHFEKPESFAGVTISARLDMNNATNLYGLLHRIVATESLLFLRDAFLLVKPALYESLQQTIQRERLGRFLAESVDVIEEVRLTMYRNIAPFLCNIEQVPNMIEKVSWDGQMTDERPYVAAVKKEVTTLNMRLEGLQRQGCFPARARDVMWECVILHVMDTLLEGYSRVRKCSNQGRAMMLMDLQSLSTVIAQMLKIKPSPNMTAADSLPGYSILEAFIKSFYQPETQFLEFCRYHTEMPMKTLVALAQLCTAHSSQMTQMTRKQKADLVAAVEEMSRSRARVPLWRAWANIRRSGTPSGRPSPAPEGSSVSPAPPSVSSVSSSSSPSAK
eukprot:m51a1_g7886 hypothetical protein (999) ;mRNA; r:68349-72368